MKGTGPIAWLIYMVVRLVLAIMQVFPIERNLRTARFLAKLWIRIMPRHRDRAVENLTAAFGAEYSPGRIRRLAAQCLESAAMFAVEAACLPRLVNAFTWTRYIRLVNFDAVLELIVGGRGLILVTAHYGSFELVGHLLACLGFDVVAVMRPIDNEYLNRFMVRARRAHGLTLLNKKGAMNSAEEVISRGGMLGVIGDQDAGRKGVFVDFFGRPASAYKSIGLLAMSASIPIVVGYCRRKGDSALYEVGVERIILPHEWESQAHPLLWITQAYTSAIESFVRTEPGQYWWMHRRWKPHAKRSRRPKAAAAPPDSSNPDRDKFLVR